MNLRGGPWSGRSRRATGARGRRRRAPSWAAARRTPRAWTRPSCAAARARPGAAPARRHSPRARWRPSLARAPSALLLPQPPPSDRLSSGLDYRSRFGRGQGRGRVVSSPVCGALRMEGGKWQRPPYPRVLRRAVAPTYAYKRGPPAAVDTRRRNANGHGRGRRTAPTVLHREIARPTAQIGPIRLSQ